MKKKEALTHHTHFTFTISWGEGRESIVILYFYSGEWLRNIFFSSFPQCTHGWIRLPSVATDRNRMIGARNQKNINQKKKKQNKKKKVCSTLSFWLLLLCVCVCVCMFNDQPCGNACRYCSGLLLYDAVPLQCPLTNISIQLPPSSSSSSRAGLCESQKPRRVSISFTRQPIGLLHFNHHNSRQIASSLNGPKREK
jgi:hypothetical protein